MMCQSAACATNFRFSSRCLSMFFCVSALSAPVKCIFSQRFSQEWAHNAPKPCPHVGLYAGILGFSALQQPSFHFMCLKMSQCNFQCSYFVTIQDYWLLLYKRTKDKLTIFFAVLNFLSFLPRDALQCKARYCDRMSSVRPSVRPSVCDVGEL